MQQRTATTKYITGVSLTIFIKMLYSTYNQFLIYKNRQFIFYISCIIFSIRRTSVTRIPHSELTKPVSKRNRESDEIEEHEENSNLPLCLQDSSIPATGVSEYERGWAVNNMTKMADEKRKKEVAERKAAAANIDSNTSVDASKNGKQAKPKKKSKRDGVPNKTNKP